jgi:monoamine oxidase
MSDTHPSPEVDVAIVGGGISGIYTGWRLLTANLHESPMLKKWAGDRGQLKVAVYEGSKRIGGRLLSARPPGMPHVTCEIGGMRYVSSQTLVKGLVEDVLKLPRHEQVVDKPNNIAYLRGKRLRLSQLNDPSALPYDLWPIEAQWLRDKNNSTSGLIGWAMDQVLPGLVDLEGKAIYGDDLRDYLRAATVDGTPLYQLGFWNLLAKAMSNEAYRLSRTTVGYDCLGSNANAVDLTAEYFDFTPDVKYYLIDGGYDLVPWTLEDLFAEQGGEVVKGAWLHHFDTVTLDDGSQGVALSFRDGTKVVARSIVLAMPRRSLQLLRPTGPVLDPDRSPRFQYLLNSVEPIPLYKLCIAYPNPWWELYGVTQGRSLTDSPVRQCYYWATEGRQPGANPKNQNSVIMAYNDESSVSFWAGLRRLPVAAADVSEKPNLAAATPPEGHGPKAKVFQRKPIPHHVQHQMDAAPDDFVKQLRENWDDHKAPDAMVKEIHRQLVQLHGAEYAPAPIDAAFVDWSDDPYGGGVHFWNPGYQSWLVLEEMIQPVRDVPCYICGEAYSTNQTWAEGALQTAELVLKKFGLAAPAWVRP